MRTLIAFTLAALLVGTTGCKGKHATAGAGSAKPRSAPHVSAAAASSAKDEALDRKLGPYARCLGDLAPGFNNSEHRYYAWVDKQKGPTGKEPEIYVLDMVKSPLHCARSLVKAKSEKPSLPALEKAGDAYVAAAEKGYPLVKEAHQYYEQENYKDDNMFKGKQLHPKLVAAFDQFDKAKKALQTRVDTLTRQLNERKLAWFLKYQGRKIPYLETHAMLLAQDVRNLGYKHNLGDIDLEKFTDKIDDFQQAVNALSTYADSHKAETQPYFQLTEMLQDSKTFLITANELRRRVRDKTGNISPEKLRWAYTALVWHSDHFHEKLR